MTKKDYIVIAKALHDGLMEGGSADALIENVIKALNRDNPKFQISKFEQAVYGKVTNKNY